MDSNSSLFSDRMVMKKWLLALILISSCVTRPKIISEGVKIVDNEGEKHFYEEISMRGTNYCLVHQMNEIIEYKVGEK
jgi:hypothetical protein